MRTRLHLWPLALALILPAAPALGQPLTTAFTYQGELGASGGPASGTYDLRFALFSAPAGGTQSGVTLCADDVAVVDGRFTVELDFGPQFTGVQQHLEILVRPDTGSGCGDASGFTTLTPRTPLTATPNASFALTAAVAQTAHASAPAGFRFPDGSIQHRAAAGATSPLVTSGLPAGSTFTVTLGGTPATLVGAYTVNRVMSASGNTPTGGYTFQQGTFKVRRPLTSDTTWADWILTGTRPPLNMTLACNGASVVWSTSNIAIRQLRLTSVDGVTYEEAELHPSGTQLNLLRTVSGSAVTDPPSTDLPGTIFAINNAADPSIVVYGPTSGLLLPMDPTTGQSTGGRSFFTCTVRTNPFASPVIRDHFLNTANNVPAAVVVNGNQWRTGPRYYPTSCTLRLADDGLPIEEYGIVLHPPGT
ncbi:MAG TPA: hypothetical protein VD997_07010 [Phycisphaerales bacterium]|nr:hypothetical protein [Phycisphaerales bacterium]